MTALKNKLFEADQRRNEEVKAKQTRITQLEAQLKEETRVRQTLSNSKESKINDLEKDIESFVKTYADENEALKKENAELKQNKEIRAQELAEFKRQTAEKIESITEALDNNMQQNQQLQSHLERQADTEGKLVEKIEQLRHLRNSFRDILEEVLRISADYMELRKTNDSPHKLDTIEDF